jgi:hypothetical protein
MNMSGVTSGEATFAVPLPRRPEVFSGLQTSQELSVGVRLVSELQKTLVAQASFVNQTLHPDVQADTNVSSLTREGAAATFHSAVAAAVLTPKKGHQ